jgi:hypothetical protein
MHVTWSWPVFLDAMVVLAVLLMSRGEKDWQDALKAGGGLAFAGSGVGILLSGAQGEILVTALLLLAAGVLLEAQAAVRPEYGSRLLLIWASATVVLAVSPWDGLIAWVDDTRRWLVVVVLLVVGRLAVAAARKHLRGTTTRPGPNDRSDS